MDQSVVESKKTGMAAAGSGKAPGPLGGRGKTRETGRIGRDELNLTEFPFALLASRAPKNAPLVMEFRDGEKEWTVTGDPRYGLPTSGDVEIYVVLMELTREQNFPVCVFFSRHEVIRRLGWDPGGQSYDRLQLGLDRLVGVTIRTSNAFWDAQQRGWLRRQAFHVLEAYDILDCRQSRYTYPAAPGEEPQTAACWIRWSPELYHNIHSGHIKSLDVGLFLSLKSSVSQALYRYLDAKRYDGKPQYRIGLRKLAWEHLGLSRKYYPSDIKRKLEPAHEELMDAGVLAGVEYAPMKSGEEMAVYRFAPRAAKAQREALPDRASTPSTASDASPRVPATPAKPGKPQGSGPVSALAQELMDRGVSRAAAVQLAEERADECRRQLDLLPFRECRDVGAALVAAIRDGWAAPPAWTKAEEGRKAREAAARKSTEARQETRRRLEDEADFDQFWNTLDVTRRSEIEESARTLLFAENRVLREFAQRRPNSPMVQDSLRPYLKKLSGFDAREGE